MFLATLNKNRQLLLFTYVGRVTLAELERGKAEVLEFLAELPPGFRLLSDYTCLESMDLDCAEEIGRVMETVDRHGVGLLIRVIPDPSKDIGLNILTHIHYRNHPRVIACHSMKEAIEALDS